MIDGRFQPFESPRLLIESAREHISEFESVAAAFIRGCRCEVVSHTDPNTRERIWKIKFLDRISRKANLLASGIIHDLRHALDQALCDVVVLTGNGTIKHLHFPIGTEFRDYERARDKMCKGMDPAIIDFINASRPYYAGDTLLYVCSSMAGPSKHRRILGIGFGSNGFELRGVNDFYFRGPGILGLAEWNAFRNEMVIARVGTGGEFRFDINSNYRPKMAIVLDSTETCLSGHAHSVFSQFATKVESIVRGFEVHATDLAGRRTLQRVHPTPR